MRSTSVQPRKQRYARAHAPLHQRHKLLSSHLNESLLVKYNRRSFPLVKGDTVKVVRGAFRGHEDKVASVDLMLGKVTVEGVTITRADGKKRARTLDPSNLVILRLNLTDPLRRDRLLRLAKLDEATKAKLKAELEAESKAQKAEIEKFKKELATRAEEEKEARGDVEAKIDPVTQKPVLEPKKEEAPAHAGGERLESAREHAPPAEEKKPAPKEEEK